MKKLFFTLVTFLSVQIVVSAGDIKDATLKEKGSQNEASTVTFLKESNPDSELITMSLDEFNRGFVACISEFNQKYKTFSKITSEVINSKIIPHLYTADLDPNKLYLLSLWNVTEKKWGRWLRKAKPQETGLFLEGWEEPIMSVYCWNFGYPTDDAKLLPRAPKIGKTETETEYVYVAGSKKVIEHGPDTVEINRTKVQIETNNNKFASYSNNQTFVVDMQSAGCNHNQQTVQYHQKQPSGCNHAQRAQQCSHQNYEHEESSCGCDNDRICYEHYQKLPKNRKPLGQRTWFKVGTHLVAFAAGWGLSEIVSNNSGGNMIPLPTRVITQGPTYW